jgi:hypothetical protein
MYFCQKLFSMKKVVFFAIAIVFISFLSSCAVHQGKCPGVATVSTLVSPA